jgi:hypothetical protein
LLPHLGFTYVTDDVMNNPWDMAAELLVLIRRRADRAYGTIFLGASWEYRGRI